MFNNVALKKLENFLELEEEEVLNLLKRQAKYLKVNPNFLLKSFKIIYEIKEESEHKKKYERFTKTKTKNIKVAKYKEQIIRMYADNGYGYLKISNALKLNHNIKISRSAIERFLKDNKIKKGK